MSIKKQTLTHSQMAQALEWVADYMDEHEVDNTDELRTAASFFHKYNPEPPVPPEPPTIRHVNEDNPLAKDPASLFIERNKKPVSIGEVSIWFSLMALSISVLTLIILLSGVQ